MPLPFIETEPTNQQPFIEPEINLAAYEPERRADQIIYLQHPTMQLRIMYWRGRVADLLIDRLGYTEITKEQYDSSE